MVMKSRSRRLFIVLLHMVGISRNLPKIISSQFSWNVGLVGVNPQHIKASVIDVSTIEGQSSPLWLMDNTDGKCLGPLGKFSECGDATLWTLRRRRRNFTNNILKSSTNHSSYVYFSLEMSDVSTEEGYTSDSGLPPPVTSTTYYSHYPPYYLPSEEISSECLAIAATTSPHGAETNSFSLKVESCVRPTTWSWRVDMAGHLRHLPMQEKIAGGGDKGPIKFLKFPKVILQQIVQLSINFLNPLGQLKRERRDIDSTIPPPQDDGEICLHRKSSSTEAIVTSCSSRVSNMSDSYHLVSFSLVARYNAHHHAFSPKGTSASMSSNLETKSGNTRTPGLDTTTTPTTTRTANLDALQMIASKHYSRTSTAAPSSSLVIVPRQLDALQMVASRHYDTSITGIQTHHPSMVVRLHQNPNGHPHINNNGHAHNRKIQEDVISSIITARLDRNPAIPSAVAVGTKQWKIPRHPYLEASKNEIWIDPITHLTYRTDLCKYLGHTRKSSGRHTLVGVGQYTRTPLKIKVYGAAFYVSKRDVLSDPTFAPYAHLNVEQLRNSLEFYELLMSTEALVDRTLLVQLNMQMSTETIRSSLQASWTMLTEEMKSLLLNSSFKAREAESTMLSKISSPLNPSRCSCGQLAPETFHADPSCCSRGTELVFTWRKTGNLELRLDGRLIDSFPRPDMARGIFYEYLRADEPMSMDARNHFADGFPFLLAPLAQVRGITSATHPQQLQGSETSSTSNLLPAKVSSSLSPLSSHEGDITQQISIATKENAQGIIAANERVDTPSLRGGFSISRVSSGVNTLLYDIVDENSVILHPTMNFTHKLFSASVHLYLMLLLIVSLPGTGSTRVVSKHKAKNDVSSSATGIVIGVRKEGAESLMPNTILFSLGSGKVVLSQSPK